MKIEKDLNTINENQFTSLFGSVFEKSEWIAIETFKKKPFKNSQDLINKMIRIYESCSIDQIIVILNLHPKLAIEKKLTLFSTKEQTGAELDKCSKEELAEFEQDFEVYMETELGLPENTVEVLSIEFTELRDVSVTVEFSITLTDEELADTDFNEETIEENIEESVADIEEALTTNAALLRGLGGGGGAGYA